MNWHRLNRSLHRDLGYLCVGLTLVYAISGIALNHTFHWNPNYRIERYQAQIDLSDLPTYDLKQVGQTVLVRLDIDQPLRNLFPSGPGQLDLFIDNGKLQVDLVTGIVNVERSTPRTGLKQINALHLNHPRRAWTWLADLYAAVLAFLAISGLFILRGKHGLIGRGGWLTLAGVVIPLLVLLL